MSLLVGASSIESLELALRDALDEGGLRVVEDATVNDSSGRHELARLRGGVPTMTFGILCERIFTVDISGGPRAPLWHLGLARRISLSLGGWAALLVNDRLFDDYGFGFYFAGHAVEGAAGGRSGLVTHFGVDPETISLDEDVNSARFRKYVAILGDRRAEWIWPPHGQQRSIAAGRGRGHRGHRTVLLRRDSF